MLTWRAAAAGAMIGVITGLLAVFLWNSMASQRESTLGLPATTTIGISLNRAGPQHAAATATELLSLVEREGVALVVWSVDTYPCLWAFDPRGSLTWLPSASFPRSGADAFLVKDSYSAQLWTRSGAVPLLPGDATVAGVIDPPDDLARVEFVVRIPNARYVAFGDGRIPPGKIVLGSEDVALRDRVTRLLEQGDVDLAEVRSSSNTEVVMDPDGQRLMWLLSSAHGCALLWWIFGLRMNANELAVRSRVGATPWALSAGLIVRLAPWVVGATVVSLVGVLGVALLVGGGREVTSLVVALACAGALGAVLLLGGGLVAGWVLIKVGHDRLVSA